MTFHIGKEICQLLPCFHTLTGSDFTNQMPGHSKIKVFKKMLKTPNSHKLLLSLLCEPNIVDKVTLIYTLYIIDLKKNLWENYVTICSNQKRTPTRWKRSITQVRGWSECTADQKSLGMKILWASFVTRCMLNCLNSCYVSIDPASNGWKFLEKMGTHLG